MSRKPRRSDGATPSDKPKRDPAKTREIAAELEVALAIWRRGGDDESLKASLVDVLKRLEELD